MSNIRKISEYFIQKGFVELKKYKLPKSLLWTPDLICSKDGHIYLILFKTNNTIPQSYLERILSTPKEKLVPIIIFAKKLNGVVEKELLSGGISFGYFIRGRISNLIFKKRQTDKFVKKEINKKLESIDIFLSSKQDIEEREFIKGRIDFLRDTEYYPFFSHLIEYEMFSLKKLYKHINEKISQCEWVIIVLEDHYSKVVSFEISRSINLIRHENIFVFIKSSNGCKMAWKKEIDLLQGLENMTIKYIPYINKNDLEVSFSKAIRKRMNELCKKNKVKIYE